MSLMISRALRICSGVTTALHVGVPEVFAITSRICRSSARARIADLQFQHEAVHLRFGQRISAFLLDGILRGQHEERFVELVGLVADGDLLFLHGFEQRALHLGGRAVDFVGEDEVGEDRAFARGEAAGLRIVNLRADDVGGQHVRRELQAREFDVHAVRQRFHGECLGQAGHAFEEDVAVGQQADDQPLGEIILADDDFAEFVEQRMRERARFLDRFVDGVDSCAHVLIYICDGRQSDKKFFLCSSENSYRERRHLARPVPHSAPQLAGNDASAHGVHAPGKISTCFAGSASRFSRRRRQPEPSRRAGPKPKVPRRRAP